MRVADQQLYAVLLGNFQRIGRRSLTAQDQVSSGKRVTRPSDDPIAFGNIVGYKSDLSTTDQWLRNVSFGTTRVSVADGTLGEVSNNLGRIKELAVRARSDTTSAGDRDLIAVEVRALQREILRLANTEVNGQRIFAGTRTDVDPFVLVSGDVVQYIGNDETQSIAVGKGQTIQVALPGSRVFTGPGADIFDGLRDLLTALETNDGSGIAAGIEAVDAAITQVTDAQGQLGAFENRLDGAESSLGRTRDARKAALSGVEDVDVAEAYTELTRQQIALEAAARSANDLFETSLLKFLR
ncbi:flagellar hook-associated protein FlgL [Candidatus Nitrospira bockiana]